MTILNTFSDVSTPTRRSILRRPSTISKFREGLDVDFKNISLPSPSKKLKVSFGHPIRHEVMTERSLVPLRSLEVVRGEVKRAILSQLRGNSEGYYSIKEIFSPSQNKDEEEKDYDINDIEIKNYLLALSSSASLLDKNFSDLVKAILAMNWIERDEEFIKNYVFFLGNLASTQGIYVEPILEMLVSNFLRVSISNNQLRGYPKFSSEEISTRVHASLKYILSLIPSASGVLLSLCAKRFPLTEQKPKLHISYVDNLIRLCDYAPELKLDILSLITDRLVQIDVQTQVDLNDLDDEVPNAIVYKSSQSVFLGGIEDEIESESDTDSEMSDDEDLTFDSKRIKEVRENVEKMDLILDMLFTVYSPYFFDVNSIEAISIFETLLAHFVNIILPTYRSRHTQFLLFHFAQKSEHLVDQFSGTCLQLAFHPGQPDVLKQAAVAYLASFIARGAHIQPKIVRTVFELIGDNLDHLRSQNELICRGPDLHRFGTFYALTQALLYIFCFRWRDLVTSTEILEDEDVTVYFGQDLTWFPGIKEVLSRTIYSKLNPLKVCSPAIVTEFAKVAHYLKFMYVYPLLETNKRIRLGQFSLANKNPGPRDAGTASYDNSWYQLEAYFPFDPYQLPISKRWIDSDYVQWKDIPGLNKDDEDETDDDESDIDEELDFDKPNDIKMEMDE
ncbi:RNA polymerase I-specific transcription initiation factor rrn3 [Erysiphe neolycopersici]|uniref:RNA polymerase I-specific transcription initiation factor rrn3 n=1 Tax=Erysiphe neolycopersici TaxID=212602 RepID=A0A420I198_9PEZI|nr:RNA polymerase I-specific transcription initiation factor rrn3 [Erysiphe neolycopersici]